MSHMRYLKVTDVSETISVPNISFMNLGLTKRYN